MKIILAILIISLLLFGCGTTKILTELDGHLNTTNTPKISYEACWAKCNDQGKDTNYNEKGCQCQ